MGTKDSESEGRRAFAYWKNRISTVRLNSEFWPAIRAYNGMGREECESIACPAVTAGFDPSTGSSTNTTAGAYDRIVEEKMEAGEIDRIDGEYVLREEDAKEAWLDAVRHLLWVMDDSKASGNLATAAKEAADAGLSIAYELGWLEEGETLDASQFGDLTAEDV